MRNLILLGASLLLVAAPAAAQSPIEGLWANPKKSVVVQIASCGSSWCGKVVKASAKQQAKAARNGVDQLEGEQMLTGLKPAGPGRWKGQVYVPKVRSKVGSTVTMQSRDRMSVTGCVAGVICKTQVWTRVN
ncbi:DUF2147 domain-containing protein [Sphingomonas sp. LHG3406-1]|uniref:DUF2147 domain-containing protein n=1 Tax=Sphingomonas sp. LHG3406-1 TaxID=2804617 RepID=UPI00263460D5|nr:DUF2147 domain-containing protein [Sphingomonas sp. LHG3406-1]